MVTPYKAHVLQSQLLHRRRFLVWETTVMSAVHLRLVVHWHVTRTVRTCDLLSKEDNETCCQWSQMYLSRTAPVLMQQDIAEHRSRDLIGSMITVDITATQLHLVLILSRTQPCSTNNLLYSNSINCSVSVIVTFTSCCTFRLLR